MLVLTPFRYRSLCHCVLLSIHGSCFEAMKTGFIAPLALTSATTSEPQNRWMQGTPRRTTSSRRSCFHAREICGKTTVSHFAPPNKVLLVRGGFRCQSVAAPLAY